MTGVGAQSGFDVWFQDFIYYAGPILQLLYWAVMVIAAIAAIVLLKRWVDYQTGASKAAASVEATAKAGTSAADADVDIEEFVE